MLSTARPPSVIHTAAPDRGKLVTHFADKRRRLFFAGNDDEVFMTHKHFVVVSRDKQTVPLAIMCLDKKPQR